MGRVGLAQQEGLRSGVRFVELEPTDHPLAVEQRTCITRERVQRIAEAVLHPEQ